MGPRLVPLAQVVLPLVSRRFGIKPHEIKSFLHFAHGLLHRRYPWLLGELSLEKKLTDCCTQLLSNYPL